MDNKKTPSYFLTLSGFLAAVTIILLYLAVLLPFHAFFFIFVSSFPMGILYRRTHLLWGLIFFVTTALLSLILFPLPRLFPYLFFFGHYGLAKLYWEERGGKYSLILKLLYFNLFLLLGVTLFRTFFAPFLPPFSPVLFSVSLQLPFLLYDYLFTRVLFFLETRLD